MRQGEQNMMTKTDGLSSGAAAERQQRHNVTLTGRNKLIISGVDDVENFDEGLIVLHTTAGLLVVRGGDLRVERLSINGGELEVNGRVDAMEYEEDKRQSGSLFKRLFS
jgi:sporulation protein YabP